MPREDPKYSPPGKKTEAPKAINLDWEGDSLTLPNLTTQVIIKSEIPPSVFKVIESFDSTTR